MSALFQMPELSRVLKLAAVAALSTYVIVVAIFYFAQSSLIFFPSKLDAEYKFTFKGEFREVLVKSDDVEVHSIFFAANETKGVILYFHGNGGAMDSWGEVAEEIVQNTGWSVWMVDYPGYGKSTGSIKSQEHLLQASQEVFNALKQQFPDAKVILYGRSIGSGVAVKLAADNAVGGLILESPYTSLTDVARDKFRFLPTFLLKYPMPSDVWIRSVKAPVLVLHGEKDSIISFKLGERLAEESGATFVAVPDGDHNDLSLYDKYWTGLQQFLKPM